MSKFTAFAEAQAALCRQHHVTIASTRRGSTIGVWSVTEGTAPVADLEDRTGAEQVADSRTRLPDNFTTAIAAEAYPGFIGRALTTALADDLVAQHPGSQAIPIGAGRLIRGWAVIEP